MNKKLCFLVDSIFSVGGVQRVTAVIAKELAKTYNVTIVTFDNPNIKDTSLYDLQQSNIHYRFFSYPHVGRIKLFFCKIYSGIYVKSRLSAKWASDLYAHSSFPSELRNALSLELQEGNYDIIIGVHAPLAARLATLRHQLPNTKLIGWLHNSYEALFGEKSPGICYHWKQKTCISYGRMKSERNTIYSAANRISVWSGLCRNDCQCIRG